jgi:hypothetical protein
LAGHTVELVGERGPPEFRNAAFLFQSLQYELGDLIACRHELTSINRCLTLTNFDQLQFDNSQEWSNNQLSFLTIPDY